MGTFEFRFQNNKASKYLGYGLLGFFAPMFLFFFLVEILRWESGFGFLLVISTLVGIGSLAYGIWKFHTHSKSLDRIILEDNGVDSQFHGYILFSEIESISGFGPLGAPPPSMRIRLHSGKKIVWYLSPTKTSFNSEKDAEVFKEFTAALEKKLATYERKQATETSTENHLQLADDKRSVDKEAEIIPVELPAAESDIDAAKLSQQVKEVTKKYNRAVWTIPVGLAFSILIFARTCGEDYFKNKRDKEVQQIFTNSDKRYNELIEESKEVLENYVPSLGAVYLYSNDTDVEVKLMPDIPENTVLNAIPTLARADQSKYLKELINNPDSIVFMTLLIHPDQKLRSMYKSDLNRLDSTQTWLYLRFYDPHERINPNPYQKTETDSTTFTSLDISTGIAIYENQPIQKSLENAMFGLRMMLAQIKHSNTFKIYLTGAEKDQVSEELFHDVKNGLQTLLQDVGVDTSSFRTEVFNQIKN